MADVKSLAENDYMLGMKYKDIAEKYNVTINTVKSWKQRYKWDRKSMHTKKKKVCIQKKQGAPPKESIAKEVNNVLDNQNLTDKQRLFCLYYVKYFNATKSYQKAYGCSYETAMVEGSNSLRKPSIKAQIDSLKQNKLNQAFLKPEDIFQKYMDIAFSDITDFLEFGREEVPVMSMYGPLVIKDEETGEKIEITKIVNTVKFKESTEVDGTIISEVKQGRDGASIKLHDRMKALQWLTDHMNMATEEQHAKIAALKAKVNNEDDIIDEDDGFIEALSGKVDEIWQEE